jgi:hypothetical protein
VAEAGRNGMKIQQRTLKNREIILNALSHARRIVLFFLFLSGVVKSTKTRCERPDEK